MTPAEIGALRHGLYRLHWKSGGASLASVGSLYNGDRWFACTDRTASAWQGIASTQWDLVAVAELLPVEEPIKPMNVLQRALSALIALESTPDPSANDLALITEVRTLEENLRLSGYFSRPERAGAHDAADLDILSEEHL